MTFFVLGRRRELYGALAKKCRVEAGSSVSSRFEDATARVGSASLTANL
jgi:hypothetical protein